jgi:hypothetical protein
MAGDAKMCAERDMALLRERAARVAAFKGRVQVAGMTRPSRSPEERAFLERQGVALPFKEVGTPAKRRRGPLAP